MSGCVSTVTNGFLRMTHDKFVDVVDSNRPPIGGFHDSLNKAKLDDHMKKVFNGDISKCPAGIVSTPKQQTQAEYMKAMAESMEAIAFGLRNGILPWQSSFLKKMVQSDVDSTCVLSSFMTLYDLWSLSKTSRSNHSVLKSDVRYRVITTMRKGAPMFYNFTSGWELAYVACVIVFKTEPKRYVYHMTAVGKTSTETLFDYEVAENTRTDKTPPIVQPNRANQYGNPGSLTSFQPHNLSLSGYHSICNDIPEVFKTTAPETCCMPAGSSTSFIKEEHIGTVVDLSTMLMIPSHARAVDSIKSRRNGPVNLPDGYSSNAVIAISNYCDYHELIDDNYANAFNYRLMSNKLISNLYDSMPFVMKPIEFNNDQPRASGLRGRSGNRNFHNDQSLYETYESDSYESEDSEYCNSFGFTV
jgi:hypothetical protein